MTALDRIVGHGVAPAEILKQRRESGRPMAYGRADQGLVVATLAKIFAPGGDIWAGHVAEFRRPLDAGKKHEVLDCILIGALSVWVAIGLW
jgi:hypothetical protein